MKVSCLQENLAKGLAIVGRAVATKSPLPILSNVMVSTDQGRLKLSATNLEIAIVAWIGAKVEEEGATTVPARLFSELVGSLPNERVDMELNVRTHTLHVSCARTEANIKGMDAADFPPIPSETSESSARVTIDAALLREMISQVAFAAAADDSRPVLAGVLMTFGDSELTMAAADGFRLSVRTVTLPTTVREPLSIIVPARTMMEVGRILADEKDPVDIVVTPNRSQIVFHLATVDVVSRLIEGTFPNYKQIIPQSYETRMVLPTTEFLSATKRASFFARDAANIVRLTVAPSEETAPGRVTITANSAEMGDSRSDLDAQVDGQSITIAFNARYLIDVLNVVGTQQVALEMKTPSSPGVVRPVGADGFLHVIMPMHVACPA